MSRVLDREYPLEVLNLSGRGYVRRVQHKETVAIFKEESKFVFDRCVECCSVGGRYSTQVIEILENCD